VFRALPFTLLGLLLGCTPEPREEQELALPAGWEILEAAQDPWPEHREASGRSCDDGFLLEDELLEIETNDCGYVSAQQGSLAALEPGDAVDLLTWHSALASAEQDVSAHYAFTLDGEILWEIDVPIPAASTVYEEQLIVDRALPEGTPIVLHLHNHGANSWRLGHLRATPSELLDP